tara:strand:+ start:204 stop:647 length:444 start_codon:yes stop_codon:yes gene_type:complete
MYSAITAFLSLSFIAFIFIQVGNFCDHYGQRAREYTRAQTYLNSDVCTNPRIIKAMAGNTKCSYYEKVMDKTPIMGAIFDTAEDIHICGNGYCSLLGHNITNSLPQIIITMGIIAVILLWASGIQLRRNRERASEEFWSLPIKTKKN